MEYAVKTSFYPSNYSLGKETFNIGCIYISPNSSISNSKELCNKITSIKTPHVLVGDYNLPGIYVNLSKIDWETELNGKQHIQVLWDKFVEKYTYNVTKKIPLKNDTADKIVVCRQLTKLWNLSNLPKKRQNARLNSHS